VRHSKKKKKVSESMEPAPPKGIDKKRIRLVLLVNRPSPKTTKGQLTGEFTQTKVGQISPKPSGTRAGGCARAIHDSLGGKARLKEEDEPEKPEICEQ